jgi:surfactin synthase thioesterase subunit
MSGVGHSAGRARPGTAPGTRWIRRAVPRQAATTRLICLPHAGGGASAYAPWAGDLPEQVELAAVQLPGREDRLIEAPTDDLDSLVDELVAALEPELDRPFALFGHSLGGLLAFEVARALQGRRRPQRLYVSGSAAPRLHRMPAVHRLGDADLLAWLREFDGTPAGVLDDPELLELVLPALRADLRVSHEYGRRRRRGPRLACPVTAFAGADDRGVPAASAAAWREETSGPFQLHVLPGGHFFIHRQRARVLRVLAENLAGA